jgi:hypothetical protein
MKFRTPFYVLVLISSLYFWACSSGPKVEKAKLQGQWECTGGKMNGDSSDIVKGISLNIQEKTLQMSIFSQLGIAKDQEQLAYEINGQEIKLKDKDFSLQVKTVDAQNLVVQFKATNPDNKESYDFELMMIKK